MFFNGWDVVLRTLLVGALAYVALVVLVRIAGKRTLGKMNAFDLIVTVALGSTLATILLNKDVALAEGVTAFVVLIGLQLLITWVSVRSSTAAELVKSRPTLLAFRGHKLDDALRSQRVADEELLQAVRQQGFGSLEETHAVVLETDGSFSVIGGEPSGDSALRTVGGWQQPRDSADRG